MFRHQERIALILLISITVAVLAAHIMLSALGKQSFATAFTNQSSEGELVVITGTVNQATILKSGGHILLEMNNVTVFVPAQVAGDRSFFKGMNCSVYGTVHTYQGKKEIQVASADDIRII
jgi:FlaG/FlaF family flagellin (archaellin)